MVVSVKELSKAKIPIKNELKIRDFFASFNSLSPILIIDEIYPCRVEIRAKSVVFEDIREILI